MREKIEQLSKGIFEYDTPSILLELESLEINAAAGTVYKGSFIIKNSKNTAMKGVIYSSSKFLVLHNDTFNKEEVEVGYEFDGRTLRHGDEIKGVISIVSSCKEVKLPFTAHVEAPYFDSSLGKVKDLFNFTNLAKADIVQALKIFKDANFPMVFMNHEAKYKVLYKELLKSKSPSSAMEEFLVAIHKKLPVTITADRYMLNYQVLEDSIKDKIILTKDNWGYGEYKVTTDAPFITLEHKILWTESFVGNQYYLDFVLHPKNMRYGNNFGRIYLKSAHQLILIEVICKHRKSEDNGNYLDRTIKKSQVKLLRNYLDFRMSKISSEEYLKEGYKRAYELLEKDSKNRLWYELIRIHLSIAFKAMDSKVNDSKVNDSKTNDFKTMDSNPPEAETLLEEFIKKYPNLEAEEGIAYCGYQYLLALLNKEGDTIEKALEFIRFYYEREEFHYMLLWILLHIDKRYDKDKNLKLQDIREQFENGCKSPILYFEAATLYNEEPSYLRELKRFEKSVFYWSTKEGYITLPAANQYIYLAGKLKGFHPVVYRTLIGIYEKFKLTEALSAICSLLIKGHKRGREYFSWFDLGISHKLRITELYEYFMYSLEDTNDLIASDYHLPQPILLYFIYNSNISDKKKAYLYAYVIKNKEKNPSIYKTYYKKMEIFALKQLAAGNISYALSILYQEFIGIEELMKEIKTYLPSVMFSCQIECKNPNMKGVYVVHEEMKEGVFTPFVNHTAVVSIFTDNYEIILCDHNDNRYKAAADYTIHRLMPYEEYLAFYQEDIQLPSMLLLHLAEKALKYQKFDEKSLALRKALVDVPFICEEFKNKNILDLIYFYYDNFDGDLLNAYLQKIELDTLGHKDRIKIIELYINRGMYHLALSGLNQYGYEEIGLNKLIKLCTYLLQEEKEEKDIVLKLAEYIFKEGKYNEEILNFLVNHYYASTSDMFVLWEGANSFYIDTTSLEERLLAQMLFAGSYLRSSLSVFLSYYKNGSNRKLIQAFLNFNAYKYLVNGRVTSDELFDIMKKETLYESNTLCTLALVKHYSMKSHLQEEILTEQEIQFADINIHKFVNKGMILPFFTYFKEIALPSQLKDKHFIEYYTNPKHRVMIHYRLETSDSMDQFVEEEMKNMYMGIFVKPFILFAGERIQYYITEITEDQEEIITESMTVTIEEMLEEDSTKYNQINYIATALEMKDDKALLDSTESFLKKKIKIKKVFLPL